MRFQHLQLVDFPFEGPRPNLLGSLGLDQPDRNVEAIGQLLDIALDQMGDAEPFADLRGGELLTRKRLG